MTNQETKKKYLEHILQNLPHEPGIYKMKDRNGHILYIGKAKDLRNRVTSYFKNTGEKNAKTLKMVEQIEDIDYTVVATELEAVMLETNLIKEFRPKYNILMKDDKNYVYIKVTTDEDYPRVIIVRKVEQDKAHYFGPKTAQHKVIKTLKVLKKIFPFRHCQLNIDFISPRKGNKNQPSDKTKRNTVKVKGNLQYPCLDYHIKRCIGPCIGTVKPGEYNKIIEQVIRFLEGKHEEIMQKLKEDMLNAAAEKKFEIAAAIRDKIQAIEDIMEKQRISDPEQKDMDVMNYSVVEEKMYCNLFQVRGGKLINQENFIFYAQGEKYGSEALHAFLEQYYEKTTNLPQEILLPHSIEDTELLEKWLTQIKGKKIKILVPKKGRKDKLLELSLQNAKSFARQSEIKWEGQEKNDREKAIEKLQELLQLKKRPVRIECYDISHFGGTETVSSMVVFENGFPKKEAYRKFKLHQQTPGSPNDFASMEETIERRLKYLQPSLVKNSLKIQKPKQKELKNILKKIKGTTDESASKKIFIVKKDEKNIGLIQLFQSPNKKTLLEKTVFSENFIEKMQLQLLLKKILEKIKEKRLYILSSGSDIDKFEEAGCQPLQKSPEVFQMYKQKKILVFDKTKYNEDASFQKKPDLIIIDGGKGQLSAAQKAVKKYQLAIPMISLAKKEEEIFVPGKSASIRLEKNDTILHMIQNLRDEAHRFALSYQKNLRQKVETNSALDEILGIGSVLKKKLLLHFGSPDELKKATLHDISCLIGKKNALKIKKIWYE